MPVYPAELTDEFHNEQLASSLRAFLWLPAIRGSLIMDTERSRSESFQSTVGPDPQSKTMSAMQTPRTTSPTGLSLDDRPYMSRTRETST